jgi:hypothetical protein
MDTAERDCSLEEGVAGLLGAEAAVIFPTGTMAQQVALRYGAERTGSTAVAMHPLSHFAVHEEHAYAELARLRAIWPTTAPRNPTADELAALSERVGTVAFELPLRDAGFVLPHPVDALKAAVLAQAEEDGDWFAGGWRATPAPGLSMTEITVAAPALELDAAAVTELGTRFLARVTGRVVS